jgi:serine/threonine protein kinase
VEGPCLSPADIDYPHKYKGKGASYAIESLPGGQLFDYISFSGAFDRQLTQHYMREICAGLNHMHSQSYAHRDLKPENLQLSEDFELKLIDFGFTANVFDSNFKWCGTEAYMSPQLIARTGKASDIFKDDIFALGVIFFIMSVGRPPFVEALKDDKYYKPLYKGLYSEFWEAQERMSGTSFDDDFKQLFTMMVQFDENARPSIQDIMQHPYMQESIYIEGGNSEIIAIMQDRRANMKVQAHENELSVQEGTRGIGEASTDDFNTDAILSQIDESKDRKDVKAADFEFIVEENHSFKSSISAHSIMVKFMTLFEADTQHRAQNEQEQKFFIKLDPETWSLNVTIKERIERAERDAELDSDDEADEAPARYNTSVLDVHVL